VPARIALHRAVTPLVWPVLAASLVGSPHCAGMCGGFAWLAAPGPDARRRWSAGYHGARLAGYAALGALAGALGASLDRLGSFAGAGRLAAVVAGAVMVLWGLATILGTLGVRFPRPWRGTTGGPMLAVARRAGTMGPDARAVTLGLFTALLPCGWLYVFVAAAATAGSALHGAALMAVFWAGTLPAFAALGLLAARATGPLRRHLPMVTGVVLVVLGCLTLAGRGPAAHTMPMGGAMPPAMHDVRHP
jgi:sulfite exporter TauE/SafE